MGKKTDRLRRAKKTRARIKKLGTDRLCVHKTSKHVYAQVISSNCSTVIACASSLDKEIRDKVKYTGNIIFAIVRLASQRVAPMWVNSYWKSHQIDGFLPYMRTYSIF